MSTPISILSGRHNLLTRHRWNSSSRRRVASTEEEADAAAAANDAEEGSFMNSHNTNVPANSNNRGNTTTTTVPHGEDDSPAATAALMDENTTNNNNNSSTTGTATDTEHGRNNRVDSETSQDVDDEEEAVAAGIHRFTVRPTMTLAELEEERELARRRSSACILFALFVLFRLWILALQEGDFGLLLLCLVGTSWAARWIRYNRDQEEELDRRIAAYLENNNNGTNGNDSRHEVVRDDMRMLSFQAQLALAIMESQRQMMQGGYGHPDGDQQAPGVSEQAKGLWKKFCYKAARDKVESRRGSYGSVAQDDTTAPLKIASDEEPHCSICLGEYEEGEELVKLPCSHIYHDECIRSWTQHHIRCPLCNYDLETAGAEEAV